MSPLTHAHILAVFFLANDQETIAGASWYPAANEAAARMASRYGCSLQTAAGVIAALSPNNKWERNLRDADSLIGAFCLGTTADAEAVKVSAFGRNKIKALNILAGADPLAVLGGLKVRAFYSCIMGDAEAVCIDGHAFSIWQGQYIPTTKTPTISAKLYAAIAADYARAAETINGIIGASYTAAQVQAITWTVWQRIRREVGQ